MAARALALLLLLVCFRPGVAGAQRYAAPPQRGVSLGLFSEDPLFSYRFLLREIADLGASHVELVVAYYQLDGSSTEIGRHPRFSAPDDTLVRTIREAHALGLKVFVFPILRLERPRSADDWRGTLRPRDPAAWWRSYARLIEGLARLCERERVALFSVGSELSTLDEERAPWEALIGRVRRLYRGPLTYSGNWDHYQKVAFYDLLDAIGLCAYFSLAPDPPARWRALRATLTRFAAEQHRPLLFTEVGYLSQKGAAAWPWDEGARAPVDLEEQRRCYEAFVAAWTTPAAPELLGAYFWNWYGWGGSASRGYTPRNKPAAAVLRRYFHP